jgi:hypothetical protein
VQLAENCSYGRFAMGLAGRERRRKSCGRGGRAGVRGVARGAVLGRPGRRGRAVGPLLRLLPRGAGLALLDQRGRALVHLLVLASLALSSGSLVLFERRADTFVDPERVDAGGDPLRRRALRRVVLRHSRLFRLVLLADVVDARWRHAAWVSENYTYRKPQPPMELALIPFLVEADNADRVRRPLRHESKPAWPHRVFCREGTPPRRTLCSARRRRRRSSAPG